MTVPLGLLDSVGFISSGLGLVGSVRLASGPASVDPASFGPASGCFATSVITTSSESPALPLGSALALGSAVSTGCTLSMTSASATGLASSVAPPR